MGSGYTHPPITQTYEVETIMSVKYLIVDIAVAQLPSAYTVAAGSSNNIQ